MLIYNIMISEFLKKRETKIVLSIIWGLGLSCLFKKVCKGRNCLVYSAPDPNKIKNNIYMFDNKCYKYNTQNTICNKNPITKL